MPHVRVDDIQLYYEERGRGPALVFIAGLGGRPGQFAGLVDAFADRYRCITFDNRGGAGQTDKPPGPYSIARFASDTAGLLDALGVDRAHVAGFSMGGMIASASRPDLAHHVRDGACSCEDAQGRDPRRCCHALAVHVVQLLERMETDAEQLDAEAEIPYELTPRALAALDPTRECAGCDDQAQDHDGPEGQCTRHGADAEGWWACYCQGFQLDDNAA